MMTFVSKKNAKVTQHDPDFEKSDVRDDDKHLEVNYGPILAVNVAKNNACICQSENVLEGHTRSWSTFSFAPFYSNCPRQQRIYNRCDQVDLQNLKLGQEIYIDPCDININ